MARKAIGSTAIALALALGAVSCTSLNGFAGGDADSGSGALDAGVDAIGSQSQDGAVDASGSQTMDANADANESQTVDAMSDANGSQTEDASQDSGSPLPIKAVQEMSADMHTTNTLVAALPGATTSHNAIIVAVYSNNAAAAPATIPVTDTLGNTFTVVQTATDAVSNSGNGESYFIAIALDISGGESDMITATTSGPASFTQMFVVEYANIARTNAFDVGTSATGVSTSENSAMASGSRTTSSPGELVFAYAVADYSVTNDPLFTVQGSDMGNIIEDRIAPTAGSYQATANEAGGVGNWAIVMATFRAE